MAYPESRNLKEVEDTLPVQCGEEETRVLGTNLVAPLLRTAVK